MIGSILLESRDDPICLLFYISNALNFSSIVYFLLSALFTKHARHLQKVNRNYYSLIGNLLSKVEREQEQLESTPQGLLQLPIKASLFGELE
jgi:hypothetical protein